MRLNPTRPSDNPMDQFLYCFGGGDTGGGGGSAGDFDDSYNQAMGYTDTLGGAGRSDDSGQARQTTAEERAAAPGYDSVIESRAIAAAGGPDYTDVFAGDTAAYNDMQRGLAGQFSGYGGSALGPSVGDTGPRFDTTTPVQGGPRDMGRVSRAEQLGGARQYGIAPAAAGAITRDEQLSRRGPSAVEDVNIFDYESDALLGAPTQVTQAAGVQAARDVSRRQTPEEAALSGSMYVPPSRRETPVTDFDGVTLPTGPGVPKDEFVQDLTPRTKEEKQMAEDRGYFNYQDLNKDGTVTDFERTLAAQGLGIVGRLSDIGRRMSIGPTTEAGTAAIPGRDFDYARTATGAISPRDPNYMGPGTLDYEGQAYGTPDAGLTTGGDGGGAGQPAVVAPIAPVTCPDGYKYNAETNACEYVGVAAPGAVGYTGAPITQTTQYTGIAGLEPFVLQPSYSAPASFSPTYNFS